MRLFLTDKVLVDYDLTLNSNDGRDSTTTAYPEGTNVNLGAAAGSLSRDGYELVEWNMQPDGSGAFYAANGEFRIRENTTLYAVWGRTAEFVTGAASGNPPENVVFRYYGDDTPYYNGTANASAEVTLAANEAEGWKAVGWTKKPASTEKQYEPTFTISAGDLSSARDVYYAILERDLKVSYDANGASGTAPAAQGEGKQVYNASGEAPAAEETFAVQSASSLTYADREFAGWNTQADGSGTMYQPGSSIKISEPTTLYAQWGSPVTYKANAGTATVTGLPEKQLKLPGIDLTLHAGKPSRSPDTADITTKFDANYTDAPAIADRKTKRSEGWKFTGWDTAAVATGEPAYQPGGTYEGNGPLELFAQWEVQNPTYGSLALPTPAARDGYDFLGWTAVKEPTNEQLEAALQPGDTYTPEADGTLYAQWKLKTYEVTYDANGGTNGAPAAQTKEHGRPLTLNDGTLAGGSAIGRDSDSKTVTLTLNYMGGVYESGSDGGAWQDEADNAKESTTTTAYTFKGWDTDASAATPTYPKDGVNTYTANAAATLYAIWGSETTGGSSFKLPSASRTSATSVTYTFSGWSLSPSTKPTDTGDIIPAGTEVTPTADTTYYAVWNPPTYAIEYDGNAGSDTVTGVPSLQSKEADQAGFSLDSGTPTRTVAKTEFTVTYDANGDDATVTTTDSNVKAANNVTYQFKGWADKANVGTSDGVVTDEQWDAYTGKKFATGNLSYSDNADLKLYAQWTKTGEVGSVTLPAPTRDGYDFLGWFTQAEGGTQVQGDGDGNYTPEGDVTLYAHWEPHTYTVVYDKNAAADVVVNDMPSASQTKTHDVDLMLDSAEPSRDPETDKVKVAFNPKGGAVGGGSSAESQYSSTFGFLSWKHGENAYAPGSTFKENGASKGAEMKLTAQWSESTTYAAVDLPSASRDGYDFLGWFTQDEGGDEVGGAGDKYTPTSKDDVTLYAHWDPHTYAVTYDKNTTDTVNDWPETNPATKVHDTPLVLAGAPTRADTVTEKFTVSFDGRGGTNVPTPVESDATIKHRFTKWTTKADGTGGAYEASASYTKEEPATLYAQWEDEAHGAELTLPAGPTLDGYTFMGWSTDKDTLYTQTDKWLAAGTKVTPHQDTVYYAVYDPPTYIVHYDANGGDAASAPADQNKKHGEAVTLSGATPTRQYVDGAYAVTYDPNGGSASKSEDTGTTKAEYGFVGWAADSAVGSAVGIVTDAEWAAYDASKKHEGGESYATDADLDLFAQWKETVTSDPASVELPAADRPGYTFLGWYDADGNRVGGAGDTLELSGEDVALHAEWEAYDYPASGEAAKYTVVFENPEDAQVATQQFTFGESQALDAGTLTPPGGMASPVFAGWRLKDGATTFTEHQLVSNLTDVDGGTVYLVATWRDVPNPVTYKVQYYEQGVDGSYRLADYSLESDDQMAGQDGEEVSVPASALDAPMGFHMDWDDTVRSGELSSSEQLVLKVYWARNSFDATFLPGATDATGQMDDQDFAWASGEKLNPNAFTRAGWKFTGWKVTERDGMGLSAQSAGALSTQAVERVALAVQALGDSVADRADGSRLTPTDRGDSGHVTLTAQWERDPDSDQPGDDDKGGDKPGGDDPSGGDDDKGGDKPGGGDDDKGGDKPGGDDPKGSDDPDSPVGPVDPAGPDGPNDPVDPNGPEDELDDLVKEAEDLVDGVDPDDPDLTDEQKKLLDEIEAAKRVLDDPDATPEQLRAATERLSNAIAAFKAASAGNGDGADSSGTGDGSGGAASGGSAAKGASPFTGDPANAVALCLAAMAALALSAMWLTRRIASMRARSVGTWTMPARRAAAKRPTPRRAGRGRHARR